MPFTSSAIYLDTHQFHKLARQLTRAINPRRRLDPVNLTYEITARLAAGALYPASLLEGVGEVDPADPLSPFPPIA